MQLKCFGPVHGVDRLEATRQQMRTESKNSDQERMAISDCIEVD
jgi:hypothetical protein